MFPVPLAIKRIENFILHIPKRAKNHMPKMSMSFFFEPSLHTFKEIFDNANDAHTGHTWRWCHSSYRKEPKDQGKGQDQTEEAAIF